MTKELENELRGAFTRAGDSIAVPDEARSRLLQREYLPGPVFRDLTAVRARLPLNGRRSMLRIALPVSAVMAAAAVVATVSAIPGPAAGPGVYQLPAGAQAQAGTAAAGRHILLTAAQTVQKVSRLSPAPRPATGRYWVTKTMAGNFLTVGPVGNHYVILEKVREQDWAARSGKVASPDLVQVLGAQFASAADEARWRRDRSPRSWNVQQDTSVAQPSGAADGTNRDITIAAGKLALKSEKVGGKQFSFSKYQMSAAELRRLPADPDRLKALLLASFYRGGGISAEAYLFEITPPLLGLPVTPAVRSALYRMLAGLPGVRSLGQVQDAAGQRGQAVALDRPYANCGAEAVKARNGGVDSARPVFGSCVVQQRLVISPRTGLPLALELRYLKLPAGQKWPAPDGLFSFELFQGAYWTNASPPSPGGSS